MSQKFQLFRGANQFERFLAYHLSQIFRSSRQKATFYQYPRSFGVKHQDAYLAGGQLKKDLLCSNTVRS